MTHVFRYVITGRTGYETLRNFVAATRDEADDMAEEFRRSREYVDARLDAIDGVEVPQDGPSE
jgi:hypothetical protein